MHCLNHKKADSKIEKEKKMKKSMLLAMVCAFILIGGNVQGSAY